MRFIDEISIFVASGTGGNGIASFRREKHVPRGGPDGGDGGHGGALILEATDSRNTLQDFRQNKWYRAGNGGHGGGRQCTGASGEDLLLMVPLGTMVYNAETDDLLADLDTAGARWTLEGGQGGLGNIHFKSGRNRTPRKRTEGKPGIELALRLELKLMADVGLLGFPNAGKSTLISRVSAARPEVGAHPFTTLTPNLGVVEVDLGRAFVVADIPGLIEGAAEGRGLGHDFLRHVERCRVYLHLVSPEDWEEEPIARYEKLVRELQEYDPELLERPRIVVLTKTDLIDEDRRDLLVAQLEGASGLPVMTVSAVAGDGVRSLVYAVDAALRDQETKASSTKEA